MDREDNLMLFHPAVIALLMSSALISLMLLYSSYYGYQILRWWNLTSGSELQLSLERRTYLISMIVSYALAFQGLSLFLYLFTADNLHTFFVGAMCAAGTLNVNSYGYPVLILKIVNFMLAGVWLSINYVDNRAYDYSLVKKKYLFLLVIMPFFLLETAMIATYFLSLSPNIITSCCGSLFSAGAGSVQSGLASLPVNPMKTAFYLSMALCLFSGLYFYVKRRGACLFSALAAVTFVVSIAAIISFISPYFYELPTHHCPFCLLQGEYGCVGYPLYVALFGGGISGIGVGALIPFAKIRSLITLIPLVQNKLTFISILSYTVFLAIVMYGVITSNLIL
jgi:hypothetical protein